MVLFVDVFFLESSPWVDSLLKWEEGAEEGFESLVEALDALLFFETLWSSDSFGAILPELNMFTR